MKLKYIFTTCVLLFLSLNLNAQNDNTHQVIVSQNNRLSFESSSFDNSPQLKPETFYLKYNKDITIQSGPQAPFLDNWINPDIQIDTGQLVSIGFRQISLKLGPDLAMYAIVNKRNITGQFNGRINIYRSDDGGLSWIRISSFQSSTLYFGQFSALVENSSSSIEDSTRVIVFYTASTSSSLLDASLNIFSVRKDGSAPIQGNVANPVFANKFFNPSAASNGAYEAENTALGVVVGEYNNTTELSTSIRYLRTTDWGQTFQGVTLADPGYPTFSDYFPSADFKLGSTDSLYIAVERRASNDTLVRIIATPWEPTTASFTHFLTASPTNHEKPSITILQTDANDNSTRQIMVGCAKNSRNAVYFRSTNAGSSWVEVQLSTNQQVDIKYVVCSSDPDTTGGGYFVAAYQDGLFALADSITIRRGTILNMGPWNLKRNGIQASGFMSPSVAIYKYTPMGGSPEKRSAFLFAGVGPSNTYYDQENLPLGITNNNGTATNFRLSQNYPNPFNPATKIDFDIPSASNVKLVIFDMLGREVTTLVNRNMSQGTYTVDFNAETLSSGIYFYRINIENKNGAFSEVKKMMLIK